MSKKNNPYVKNVSTWDSGGGVTLGLVELDDGSVLGISDEVIILYANMDDVMGGEPSAERQVIYR